MKEQKKDTRETFIVYVEFSPNRYDLDTIKAANRKEAERIAESMNGYVVK